MLDTNVLNTLFEEGAFIYDGDWSNEEPPDEELIALRGVMMQAQRQQFQLVTSPLSVAEVVNIQSPGARRQRLGWFLEMLDYWIVELDGSGDRQAEGGSVRHRFKLTRELQALETALLAIPDLRRDPFDRLLVLHARMANCDVLLTRDRNTLWRHRARILDLGLMVVTPSEYLRMIAPWSAL